MLTRNRRRKLKIPLKNLRELGACSGGIETLRLAYPSSRKEITPDVIDSLLSLPGLGATLGYIDWYAFMVAMVADRLPGETGYEITPETSLWLHLGCAIRELRAVMQWPPNLRPPIREIARSVLLAFLKEYNALEYNGTKGDLNQNAQQAS